MAVRVGVRPARRTASSQIQLGREFQRIETSAPVAEGGRIEVIEFFYYGCPVCYEPSRFFSRWLGTTPGYVAIRRVPAASTEAWEPFAKTVLYPRNAGTGRPTSLAGLRPFSLRKRKAQRRENHGRLGGAYGIERQKFVETYGSPGVAAKVARARELLKAYDVRGVPTFIVDGSSLLRHAWRAAPNQVVQVVDHLVKLAPKSASG